MPKAYPPEFRRRALDLVQAGRSVVQVAADLGISQGCLYSWRKQELIDTGQLSGLSSAQAAELTAARRRIRELEAENEILRRASLAFKDVVPPKDRFGLVADLAGDGFSIQQGCRVLAVSEAGYYEWRHRAPSQRTIRHAWLTDQITEVHVASRGVYGALRVRAELVHGRGIVVGHNAAGRAEPAGPVPATRDRHRRRSRRPPLRPHRTRPALGHRHHRASNPRGQDLLLRRARRVVSTRRRLVDRLRPHRGPGHERSGDGDLESTAGRGRDHPLRQ